MSQFPSWQPDSDAVRCYLCKAAFTVFNRRHHCRKCGQVVCNSCSSQNVKYFPASYVLNPVGPPSKASGSAFYRTCDVCAEEINMIRRSLVNSSSSLSLPSDQVSSSQASSDGAPTAIKVSQKTRKSSDTASTSSGKLIRDTDSDLNLCPVCGIDLWEHHSQTNAGSKPSDTSLANFEDYKESHISQCLVTFDFANDNMRLSSPPGASQARNRMLVYHIPPIPEPSYEVIKGSTPNSIETLSRDKTITGSTISNTTLQGEKDTLDDECVICLENLRPGDKVGRLECLCVFHYKCIKDWFNKKSFAECPVHFLHR